MKPSTAPGPDGMSALFFQKIWSIVGDEVTSIALNILNNGGDPSTLNHTYICLIPKKKKYRPISLLISSLKLSQRQ